MSLNKEFLFFCSTHVLDLVGYMYMHKFMNLSLYNVSPKLGHSQNKRPRTGW
jgi:hypothetical protein